MAGYYRCDRCGAATFMGRCTWCDTAREIASCCDPDCTEDHGTEPTPWRKP